MPNHLQDPREDADESLSDEDSPTAVRLIKLGFFFSYNHVVQNLAILPPLHSMQLLPNLIVWQGPFCPHASHHYLMIVVGLLPNDILPFPVVENCPIPVNFQPFFPVLIARTRRCSVPHISLFPRFTRLSSMQCLIPQ